MSIPLSKSKHRPRGSILLLTLFFMVVISLFAVAFWNIIPVELHSARRYKDDTRAYYVADAGVVDCLAFLEKETTAGNVDQHFADEGSYDGNHDLALTRTGELDGWDWSATITPGPGTYGYHDTSSPNPIRVYRVESTASRGNQKYRSVSAWVSQDSFGGKNWTVNAGAKGNDLWLNMATFKLGGDYHTNDYCRINIPNSSFWNNRSAAVGGKITFATPYTDNHADNVIYMNWDSSLLPYNPDTGASVGTRYQKITAHGQDGIQLIEPLTLPANTDSVAFGTWGGDPPAGSLASSGAIFGSAGVNARINGATPGGEARNGIYIEGDVSQIDMDVVNSNQRIRIDQGNKKMEVTFVTNSFTIPAGGTVNGAAHPAATSYLGSANDDRGFTVIRNLGTNNYTVYQGQTNGAIYATGDINGVRGVTKGRRTIATQTNENGVDREIHITGPLTYAGTEPGQTPASAADQLGLIAYAVRVESSKATAAPSAANPQDGKMWPPRNSTDPDDPLYLYCSIFAGRNDDPMQSDSDGLTEAGGFGVEDYDKSSLGAGHMVLFGSLTEGVRQAKGTFNSRTGESSSGYSYSFFEDPNLKETQPPFFPTLPRYNVISWEEKSVFAY
jgi:hypothetical protein